MNESEMDFRDEEVATMKAERDQALAAFIKQCGDVDRLRAALEQILRGPWELEEARHIAHRALEEGK